MIAGVPNPCVISEKFVRILWTELSSSRGAAVVEVVTLDGVVLALLPLVVLLALLVELLWLVLLELLL